MADTPRKKMSFDCRKLYLKDLSFESPNSPDVFVKLEREPTIDIQMKLSNRRVPLEENFYEVVLTLTVSAKAQDQTMFLVEVQQAGMFQIEGVADRELAFALEVASPVMLLPFAREVISDVVTKGGFPQLLVSPINFEAIYAEKRRQKQQPPADKDAQTVN